MKYDKNGYRECSECCGHGRIQEYIYDEQFDKEYYEFYKCWKCKGKGKFNWLEDLFNKDIIYE